MDPRSELGGRGKLSGNSVQHHACFRARHGTCEEQRGYGDEQADRSSGQDPNRVENAWVDSPRQSEVETYGGGAENHRGGDTESEESGRQSTGMEALESRGKAQAHQDQPEELSEEPNTTDHAEEPDFVTEGPEQKGNTQPQEQLCIVHHGSA